MTEPPPKDYQKVARYTVARYTVNIQKSVVFLYTNNKLSEREIKEIIPFKITSKRIKYLPINLTKEVKNLYLENYKTVMQEIEDNTNRQKDIMCLYRRIKTVKVTILPKAIFRFNASNQNTLVIFHRTAAAKSLQSCPTLCDPIDGQPTRLPHPWDSPGKNTGVGCHFLLQGIFLTQGLNQHLLCLLHWQVDFFFFFKPTALPGYDVNICLHHVQFLSSLPQSFLNVAPLLPWVRFIPSAFFFFMQL